jgi:1-acyl-sn-glycerol-3-phosphate acyltransferase
MDISFKSFLISIYIWSFLVVSLLPLFLVYLIIWLLVLPFDSRRIVTHYYTKFWARLYLLINPWWTLTIDNREMADRSKPVILVSNHQSIMDIALLLQLNVQFRWVCKVELVLIPVVGWVIRMNRHILVRRGDRQSVYDMAEACKRSLSEGISVYMFPEGTRTMYGDLGPFKDGAFILAKETGTEIMPVIIDGASVALPKKGLLFRGRQHFRIRVLKKIPGEVIQALSLEQLVKHTRDTMANGIKQLHLEDEMNRHGKNTP